MDIGGHVPPLLDLPTRRLLVESSRKLTRMNFLENDSAVHDSALILPRR